jgi:hypothetical protein
MNIAAPAAFSRLSRRAAGRERVVGLRDDSK